MVQGTEDPSADALAALIGELSLGAAGVFAVLRPAAGLEERIGRIEAGVPGRPAVRLDLTDDRADWAALEPRAPEPAGRLIQVVGVEELSDARRLDLLGRLQGMLESTADAVLVWMPAAFERQFFFRAPELHDRLRGVVDLGPPAGDRTAPARRKPPALPPEAVGAHYRTVIDQYENWARVRRAGAFFRLPEMAAADLHAGYRPTYFANKKGRVFPLDDLLDRVMANPDLNFLGLLGGEGAGKTAFAVHYFVALARRWLSDPARHRMPVFLSLGGLTGRVHFEGLLIDRFEADFGVRLSVLALQDQLLRGRFVFIVDGFDEMDSAGDRFLVETHLEGLARLAMKNVLLEEGVEKPQPANKVVLTVRPHFFLADAAGPGAGNEGHTSLYREYAASGNFQLVRLLPKTFEDAADFRGYLVHALGDGIAARNLLSLVTRETPLAPIPLLREMIARTVPAWRHRATVGMADLFRGYIGLWCGRLDWRSRLTSEGRWRLLRRMALRMVSGEGTLRLSPSDVPTMPEDPSRAVQGAGDPLAEELATCEFVHRDPSGDYRFFHPAFAYFLCAESCVARIRRRGGEEPVPHDRLGTDVRGFLAAILSAEKAELSGLTLSGVHLEGADLYQARMENCRLDRAFLSEAVLMDARLAGADLTAADLSHGRLTRADLSGVDLSGANLTGVRLREANLSGARLNGADLRGADLRGARLRGVRAAWVDFHDADLTGADLSGAILSDAVLAGVRLAGVRLKGAHASGANFSGADLAGAEAAEADLSGADLSNAALSEANLTWAELGGAIFTGARLQGAKLRESRMERAALTGVAANRADFRMARMAGARMSDAVLQEADFSKAHLNRARMERADLSWAILIGAHMEGVEAGEARFNMAKLMDAVLAGGRLTGADFTWADLSRADLSRADLCNANLSEADLTDARLTGTRMEGSACRETTFPGADGESAPGGGEPEP
jgi:uncharacterized protein YjbI with pentapeptide repeats